MKLKVLYENGVEQIVEADNITFSTDLVSLNKERPSKTTTTRKGLFGTKTTVKESKEDIKIGLIKSSAVLSVLQIPEPKPKKEEATQ
jgi:hypothetical protein